MEHAGRVTFEGPVRLRRYQTDDAAATWQIFHAAVRRTAQACYGPAQVAARAPDDVDVDRWVHRRAKAWTVVAVEGDRVVGFADLTGDGEMDMLFVHPDYVRRGIATALVDRVTGQAAERGLARVTVHASRGLQPPLTRLGFAVDQDHPDNRLDGQVLANATMHLDL